MLGSFKLDVATVWSQPGIVFASTKKLIDVLMLTIINEKIWKIYKHQGGGNQRKNTIENECGCKQIKIEKIAINILII